MELFVLQCDTHVDSAHILLAKYIIDQLRGEFLEQLLLSSSSSSTPSSTPPSSDSPLSILPRKHLLLLFHVQRSDQSRVQKETKKEKEEEEEGIARWQLNYQSGWSQVFIDTLELQSLSLKRLLTASFADLLQTPEFQLEKQVREAFEKIKPHSIGNSSFLSLSFFSLSLWSPCSFLFLFFFFLCLFIFFNMYFV